MKKTRLLMAILVCAVMLMGVSYAWWTDSVAISGTATTGNLSVKFQNVYSPTFGGSVHLTFTPKKIEDDEIAFTIANLYPDAYGFVNFEVKNYGSIPVKLEGAEVEVEIDSELDPYLIASGELQLANNQTKPIAENTLGQLAQEIECAMQDVVLDPDEIIKYRLDLSLASSAENETQGKSAKFKLIFNWQQFNEPSQDTNKSLENGTTIGTSATVQ